ncbi:hypothetical protein CW700_08020 [Candidatus Bathyarchaeota archaeon]|nr:DUF5320 domain-containing protein [Candidatus Bathyarchaeota archaeon]RJS88366.1 MAG: hypothetical protein CW700_08020 [Candidatus Bathyarchaeota archaeon]
MEERYLLERIRALEAELEMVKRRISKPRLTEEEIDKRIQAYRRLVREVSEALEVYEDPDSYIAKLRFKEY